MAEIKAYLHKENIPLYVKDTPYVKEYADGSVDYCLGANYESAAMVIKALIEIKKNRDAAEEQQRKKHSAP
jgi:hypothetical protein